ncbi:hypothetical protein LR002_01570 [Candidatus Gracilibacteria bacterium]|nr:hypothetical protein [Candidatus Gracilibacteria bacterium]
MSNLFGFGTTSSENVESTQNSVKTETVQNTQTSITPKQLVSSGTGDVLLYAVVIFSVFAAIYVKKFA